MTELKRKQYIFTFEGGGWNTVWAKTKRGAVKAAIEKYKDSSLLNPIESSVILATKERLDSAMSLFY